MISLKKYSRKDVKIFFKDGTLLSGFVSHVDEIESNEDGIETMTLECTGLYEYVSVSEDEIESIEIIE